MVRFYVGQLPKSRITLKDGFHAKAGCIFHAYTKGEPVGTIEFEKRSIPFDEEKNIALNTGNDFYVFPNPAKDVINMSFFSTSSKESGFVIYKIYSLLGEEIYNNKAKINQTITVPINNIPRGLYFIRAILLNNEDNNEQKAFLKFVIIE